MKSNLQLCQYHIRHCCSSFRKRDDFDDDHEEYNDYDNDHEEYNEHDDHGEEYDGYDNYDEKDEQTIKCQYQAPSFWFSQKRLEGERGKDDDNDVDDDDDYDDKQYCTIVSMSDTNFHDIQSQAFCELLQALIP